MSGGANPYTLFLILILLILGMDPDCDKKLGNLRTLIDKAATTLSNLKTGVNAINTDMEEMHLLMMNLHNPRR